MSELVVSFPLIGATPSVDHHQGEDPLHTSSHPPRFPIDRSIDPISSWCAELHELGTRQIMGFITAAPVRIDLRHAISATSLSLGPSLPRCLSRGSCYTTYKQATQRDLYIIHNFYNILDTTRVGLSTAVVTKNAQCFQPRPRMWRNILMIKA